MDCKQFFDKLSGKKIAMCGIGVSNTPLILSFLSKGARVIACDRRSREQIGTIADDLERAGAELQLGENYLQNLEVDIIFRTPGMNFYLPELEDARKKGIPVTSEMEVFFDLCPATIFAVTGSDGKTTTTTLIAKMLEAEGKKVFVGGNIGNPLLPEIENITKDDYVVVELSSFQLISMRKSPDHMLAHRSSFVKYFFQVFANFFPVRFHSRCSRGQLAYTTIHLPNCQAHFTNFAFSF